MLLVEINSFVAEIAASFLLLAAATKSEISCSCSFNTGASTTAFLRPRFFDSPPDAAVAFLEAAGAGLLCLRIIAFMSLEEELNSSKNVSKKAICSARSPNIQINSYAGTTS